MSKKKVKKNSNGRKGQRPGKGKSKEAKEEEIQKSQKIHK